VLQVVPLCAHLAKHTRSCYYSAGFRPQCGTFEKLKTGFCAWLIGRVKLVDCYSVFLFAVALELYLLATALL